ncbi:bifunctional 5,10-methylenetetrahydrofolate dehydrogenase/5,10-methenyltetrahydrofolate cyclohydrolase [Sphingosinicella rhizophila]|uniref:Bifunctional protein FolD n=1 Tax=Sphingosinicella rhizophila TaxID=3050082 RepID=A0ABU3QC76_9SPHN|nr:bifunctional methylenetetrahydrofolate dehydrogenase/methenyltetrahydrofolate cyclohydrolase FolD [Sphingosinicella sp. GR2756]MDT9601010.1 bifunctional methylenetetrahydrofolate dehydrogenase/methenyltetrahydrofolate cyclohydrolase FolD [Sphingosinicella sp. GR2756]
MPVDTRIIDGRLRAETLSREVAAGAERLRGATGVVPKLVTILVGEDPASKIYVRRKAEHARAIGMRSVSHHLDADLSEAALLALIAALNADREVHGILVQLPLPPQIDRVRVLAAIDPAKDIDGFHPMNVGLLASDGDGIVPCTPRGCMMLLEAELGSLQGLNALVVGCSNIVGRPMAQLLLRAGCTVSIAHIHTRDLPTLVATADLLVSAAGAPGLIRGGWLKPGATVIDVGINRVPKPDGDGTRIVGDVRFDEALGRAAAITPVPGGVGPMTIACLLDNVLRSAERLAAEGRCAAAA